MACDDINRLNHDEALCLVDVSPGGGFAQFQRPVLVRTGYHVSRAEFERRKACPWPAPNEFTVGGPVKLAAKIPAVETPPVPPATLPAPVGTLAAAPPEEKGSHEPPAAVPASRGKRARGGTRKQEPMGPRGHEPTGPAVPNDQTRRMEEYLKTLMAEQTAQT